MDKSLSKAIKELNDAKRELKNAFFDVISPPLIWLLTRLNSVIRLLSEQDR